MFGRGAQTVTIRALPERRPLRWWQWLLLFVFVMLLGFGGWRLYVLGGERAGFDRDRTTILIKELNASLASVVEERDNLRRDNINMERTIQIDSEAAKTVRAELLLLQEERQQLREEVELLKKILGNNSVKNVLRITAFNVFLTETPNEFRFEAAVSRVPEADTVVAATLTYQITGLQAGEPVEYSFAEIDSVSPTGYRAEFKQLGRLSGKFALPAEFIPESLIVNLKSADRKSLDAEFHTAWQPLEPNGVSLSTDAR